MPIPRHQSARSAILAGVTAVVLAACGGGGGDDAALDASSPTETSAAPAADAAGSTSSGAGASSPQSAELAAALTQAFAGSTTLADDVAFDGATLAGGDSVVWFWAPWCTICRAEAPEVAEIAEQYGADITLVGVPGRGELDAMRSFVDDTGTGALTHVADVDGAIWSAFGVYGQPAFAFIDDDGSVEVFIGGMGGDALAERIDELITT